MLCARREPQPSHVLQVTRPRDPHAIQGTIPWPLHMPHLWQRKTHKQDECSKNRFSSSYALTINELPLRWKIYWRNWIKRSGRTNTVSDSSDPSWQATKPLPLHALHSIIWFALKNPCCWPALQVGHGISLRPLQSVRNIRIWKMGTLQNQKDDE